MSRPPPRRTCGSRTSSRRTSRRITPPARAVSRQLTGAPILVHESAPVEFLHVGIARMARSTTLATCGSPCCTRRVTRRTASRSWSPTRLEGPGALVRADRRYALRGRRGPAGSARRGRRESPRRSSSTRASTASSSELPDHIEVFPAHFGGSACGKGLSGKPGSTIGFERRFNPALQLPSKAEFVELRAGRSAAAAGGLRGEPPPQSRPNVSEVRLGLRENLPAVLAPRPAQRLRRRHGGDGADRAARSWASRSSVSARRPRSPRSS